MWDGRDERDETTAADAQMKDAQVADASVEPEEQVSSALIAGGPNLFFTRPVGWEEMQGSDPAQGKNKEKNILIPDLLTSSLHGSSGAGRVE